MVVLLSNLNGSADEQNGFLAYSRMMVNVINGSG
jgi:hypothetical protein